MNLSGRETDLAAGLETIRGEPLLDLVCQLGVARHVRLTRTATRPLARDHGPTLENLAAPDTPGLVPLDRTGQALDAQRALPAERLRQFQLGRGVREPQVRVELPTGQVCLDVDAHVDRGQRQTLKARSPLSSSTIFWIAVLVMHRPVSRQKIRPRTLYGFRGLEVSR